MCRCVACRARSAGTMACRTRLRALKCFSCFLRGAFQPCPEPLPFPAARSRPACASRSTLIRPAAPVVLFDDDDRENEADLIVAAERITRRAMALADPRGQRHRLPVPAGRAPAAARAAADGARTTTAAMARPSRCRSRRAQGVATGVSAADRVTTIRAAICRRRRGRRPGQPRPCVPAARRTRAACWSGAATPKARSS